jgi:arginine repressor
MASKLEMPDKKEFSKLYLSHSTVFDLAEKYFVSVTTISKWIKAFGLVKTGNYLRKEDIQRLLKMKLTFKEMAKKLDCSIPTLSRYLKKFGLIKNKVVQIDIKELYNLRVNSEWTIIELAQLYEVSTTTIEKRCKEHEFPKVIIKPIKHYPIQIYNRKIYK